MSARKANILRTSTNNIVLQKTYDSVDSKLIFSKNNGSSKILEQNSANIITNNTINPPKNTMPEAYHPTLINYCTTINTFIKNGYFVPYLDNKHSILAPSVEEIYYTD